MFEGCSVCGLVRNREPTIPDYSMIPRATKRQLPVYTNDIIQYLLRAVDPRSLVVEVGCNDGTFLERLREAGYTNAVGVEPSVPLATHAREREFRIIPSYFGLPVAKEIVAQFGYAAAVICRHTLEHVPDPLLFMQAIAELLESREGLGVIEVPDSTVIWENLSFFELWDQHLFYFNSESLARLVVRSGLVSVETQTVDHLETRNLVAFVRKGSSRTGGPDSILDGAVRPQWIEFGQRIEYLRARLGGVIRAAEQPVHLIGASHPQTNFANILGIGPNVRTMIDDDLGKRGNTVTMCGGRSSVISTDQFLHRAGPGMVVSTGFGYPDWSRRICAHGRAVGMAVVDPREFIKEALNSDLWAIGD